MSLILTSLFVSQIVNSNPFNEKLGCDLVLLGHTNFVSVPRQSYLLVSNYNTHAQLAHLLSLHLLPGFQKARLSPNEVKEIQLKLQHKEAALKTAEKAILSLQDTLTQNTFSYTTKTKEDLIAAAQALAVTEAALMAAKREAATAVSGREKALASLQVCLHVFAWPLSYTMIHCSWNTCTVWNGTWNDYSEMLPL